MCGEYPLKRISGGREERELSLPWHLCPNGRGHLWKDCALGPVGGGGSPHDDDLCLLGSALAAG